MMYLFYQDGDLSDMPSEWEDFWQRSLDPKTARLYERICRSEYAETETPISHRLLADQCGMSRTALIQAFNQLEDEGFVAQFDDEGINYVSVYAPPIPSTATRQALDPDVGEQIKNKAATKRRIHQTAKNLVALWSQRHNSTLGKYYPSSAMDIQHAKEMLWNNPDRDDFESLVRFYWDEFKYTPGSTAFTDFCLKIDDIRQRKVDDDEGLI